MPDSAAEAKEIDEFVGPDPGHDEQPAEIEDAEPGKPFAPDVADGEFRIGPKGMEEAAVLAGDQQDHGLAGRKTVGYGRFLRNRRRARAKRRAASRRRHRGRRIPRPRRSPAGARDRSRHWPRILRPWRECRRPRATARAAAAPRPVRTACPRRECRRSRPQPSCPPGRTQRRQSFEHGLAHRATPRDHDVLRPPMPSSACGFGSSAASARRTAAR